MLPRSYCTAIASPDDASDCHGIYSGSLNAVVGAVGVQAVFVMDLASYVVTVAANIFLPWIAIHLLHHSVPKGVEQRRGDDLVGQVVTWKQRSEGGAEGQIYKDLNIGWETKTGKVVEYLDSDEHVVELGGGGGGGERRVVPLHRLPYIMRREFGKNHVHKLLVWDVCACVASFLLVFLAFALTEKLRADVRPWMIMGGICWFRIIYSCTTFPFLVFRLPVLNLVLSHARPTGYTKSGKCVPKMKIWPWYDEFKPPAKRASCLQNPELIPRAVAEAAADALAQGDGPARPKKVSFGDD